MAAPSETFLVSERHSSKKSAETETERDGEEGLHSHVFHLVHELAKAPVAIPFDVDKLVVMDAVHVPRAHLPREDARQKDVQERRQHVVQPLHVPAARMRARSDVKDANQRTLKGESK